MAAPALPVTVRGPGPTPLAHKSMDTRGRKRVATKRRNNGHTVCVDHESSRRP